MPPLMSWQLFLLISLPEGALVCFQDMGVLGSFSSPDSGRVNSTEKLQYMRDHTKPLVSGTYMDPKETRG